MFDFDPRSATRSGRELVQDDRENLFELDGEDSRMLATIGAFRVISERDLHDARDASMDRRSDTLEHLGGAVLGLHVRTEQLRVMLKLA